MTKFSGSKEGGFVLKEAWQETRFFFPTILHDIHWLSYQIDYMLSRLGQIGMTTKSCTYRNWMFDWITIDQEQPALHLLGLIIAWLNDYLFVPRTSLIDLCIFIPLIHAHISYRFPSRGGVPIGKSIKKSSAYPGQWSQLCVHSLPPPWFLLFFSIWIVDGTIHTICSPCHIFGHHRRRSWWGIGPIWNNDFFGCNKTTDDSSPIFAACVFCWLCGLPICFLLVFVMSSANFLDIANHLDCFVLVSLESLLLCFSFEPVGFQLWCTGWLQMV